MTRQTRSVVLEPSSNTHTITNVLEVEQINPSIIKVETAEGSAVIHGEHGTLGIESKHVIKYVQQELNPITGALQNAWD
jgi:hypothetical protein